MSKHNRSRQAPLVIDPFQYMEMDKNDIFYKLTSELGYSQEEALLEFDSMTAMLTRLKPMRSCQPQTDDWLKDAVPQLHRGVKILTVTILLDATKGDDSYCHAYNTFVYYSNRYLRTDYPRKKITDHQLLILLENEKAAAALPETKKINSASPRGNAKTGKRFSDYLLHENQTQLSEICKMIFTKNNSPKEYAIMLCLLSEKGFIVLMNRQRTDFYISWYNFINKKLPSRNNFNGINKYIDDKASSFIFKDEDDGDYRSLKNTFDNILIKNNLE